MKCMSVSVYHCVSIVCLSLQFCSDMAYMQQNVAYFEQMFEALTQNSPAAASPRAEEQDAMVHQLQQEVARSVVVLPSSCSCTDLARLLPDCHTRAHYRALTHSPTHSLTHLWPSSTVPAVSRITYTLLRIVTDCMTAVQKSHLHVESTAYRRTSHSWSKLICDSLCPSHMRVLSSSTLVVPVQRYPLFSCG